MVRRLSALCAAALHARGLDLLPRVIAGSHERPRFDVTETERCPDFQGKEDSIGAVLEAGPDIYNHNTETVPRLYKRCRPGGRYERVMKIFERAKQMAPQIPTKTGIILGMGETNEEVVAVMRDLRAVDVDILTLGQYLRPSDNHAVMTRYYHPDEFRELKRVAMGLGFVHVEAGPLVRSSYHAHEQADAVRLAGHA